MAEYRSPANCPLFHYQTYTRKESLLKRNHVSLKIFLVILLSEYLSVSDIVLKSLYVITFNFQNNPIIIFIL